MKTFTDAAGRTWAPVKPVEEIKQGIQIEHSDLDRFGGLSRSSA